MSPAAIREAAVRDERKPRLSLARVLQMNLGFLGLQFSFGLQQANMAPIYSVLGASEASLPLLSLAGPMTGLLVQPLVGALSDRTISRLGRRTPYFLVGAVLCTLGLVLMPQSRSLWMAASLLWLLDAANNITMEPYRAYVSDRLPEGQHQLGFLTQSAFTGLAQTLAYLTPSILVFMGLNRDAVDASGIPVSTRVAFFLGAALSISTIAWSVWRVPELPLDPEEVAVIRARPATLATTLGDIGRAVRDMPQAMRRMALMCLFQWYAMASYWGYVAYAISRSLFGSEEAHSAQFREALLINGRVGALYNVVAFVAAFAMVPIVRRRGPVKVHAACLALSGLAMLALPRIHDPIWLVVPALGIGVGWASMMGNPYAMLADSVPPERTGVYMGIFNMFIVIPMLLIAATLPFIYKGVLGDDPRNVLTLAGGLMLCGAAATLRVKVPAHQPRLSLAAA